MRSAAFCRVKQLYRAEASVFECCLLTSLPPSVDWMALNGINLFLAMTGQEEVQYKVFSSFGLNDTSIRQWFNGPALLTWSRGQVRGGLRLSGHSTQLLPYTPANFFTLQNEYGNDIAGPLPRSWMRAQWDLQRLILGRTRPLGMIGQLPAFQGNVPAALKTLRADSNMTIQGDTAWMDSLDPLYGKIADAWMKQLLADFGTDHWYQLDGYFDGGTAPWLSRTPFSPPPHSRVASHAPAHAITSTYKASSASALPPCSWSPLLPNSYLKGCSQGCKSFSSLANAQAACLADDLCGGITSSGSDVWELRSDYVPQPSPSGEVSYAISNFLACRGNNYTPDPMWIARGAAAYRGVNRTDPDAVWSFQVRVVGGCWLQVRPG